jgi:TRAP-type C4-dicarboxylate transport system substrate-binding protein
MEDAEFMTESLDQIYERKIREAEKEYLQVVAKLNADFQEKLKPFNQTYNYFVQQASEYRDQMVQDALDRFDADTAPLRAELEKAIEEAQDVWGDKIAKAEREWHEGMSFPTT